MCRYAITIWTGVYLVTAKEKTIFMGTKYGFMFNLSIC